MVRLTKSLDAWGTSQFKEVLAEELERLDSAQLPLQQGLTKGSHVLDGQHQAMILNASDEAGALRIKAGIFYTSIIAGCQCADDPSPENVEREYCEVQLNIDKQTAETRITLSPDS